MKGQQIDYSRGRGLGGSTAINFSCWIVGADEDFNEWAKKVGDETWKWANVKERLKKLETYHVEVPEENRKYLDAKQEGKFPVLDKARGKLLMRGRAWNEWSVTSQLC